MAHAEALSWSLRPAEQADSAEKRAARESQRPLTLHVLWANPRAVALYEREGPRVVDVEPLRLRMRSGA
jgi:hypothetical protein